MAQAIAKERVHVALKRNVSTAADADVRILDRVLVYRESPVNKWLGPFTVLDIQGKAVYINVNGKASRFSIDKVKPYRQEADPPERQDDVPAAHDVNDDASADALNGQPPGPDDEPDEYEKVLNWYWGMDRNEGETDVNAFTVKILKPSDDRAKHDDFKTAKADEVDGLRKRCIWEKVNEKDIPPGANILGGRFILTLNNCDTPQEKAKVRYVDQGFNDQEKPYLLHDMSTLRVSSIRVIMSVTALMSFRLFSHDVTHAYLQSKSHLTLRIFIRPKPHDREVLGIGEGEIFELVRPLYGLCDAGDYWGETMQTHLMNYLNMQQTHGDPALYIWKENNKLAGITGMYVDDLLNAGNLSFQNHTVSTLKTF